MLLPFTTLSLNIYPLTKYKFFYSMAKNEQIIKMSLDENFMNIALEEAALAYEDGEAPVGAVIARGEELLARAHNNAITLNDPSAHAEVLAIRRAAERTGNYRLPGTTLYVTLEPCMMCSGAIIQARIARVVFGAKDPKSGTVISLYRLLEDRRLNHKVEVGWGICHKSCSEILTRFFREKRIA
jgi:tRNA(adenine34) deaminase